MSLLFIYALYVFTISSPAFPIKFILIGWVMSSFEQLLDSTVAPPRVRDTDLCVGGPLNIPDFLDKTGFDECLKYLKFTAFAI